MSKVAWIGLGVMGYPMAGHLKMRGHHDVVVFNRTRKSAEAWVAEFGGTAAHTPAAAARDADFIFTCVGNDDDLRQVTLGPDGAFSALKQGAVAIDNTTASAEIARELHAAGSGQLTKMVNQICIGGLIQGLAEALHFAKRAGLDIGKVIDTISKGAAQSWQMENRWKTMVEGKFDFGFAVDLVRKDFALVFDEARRKGAELPVTALVDQFYAEVQAMGGNRWDTSSLIALLERKP
jgi:3-hydroxyisobutyrate dehydrogenase